MQKTKKEFDINKLKEGFKRFKDSIWNFPDYPFLDKQLLEYYKINYSKLYKKLKELHEEYPINFSKFWLNLIKSNFSLKFLSDIDTIFSHKKEIDSIEKAIKIIKATFENSYHYYGIFTICDEIKSSNIKDLYELWYKPNKAKECKGWKLNSKNVSGKYWVLNKCSLFNSFSYDKFDIKILKRIKDCDSHQKLIIKQDNIILIDRDVPEKINKKTLIKIANYLKGTINICLHFYSSFVIKEKFYLCLLFYAINSYEYSNKKINYNIFKDKNNKKVKKRSSRNIDDSVKNKLKKIIKLPWEKIGTIILNYFLNDIWDEIYKEIPRLNKYLINIDLQIDNKEFIKRRSELKYDICDLILIVNWKINELVLKKNCKYKKTDKEEIKNLSVDFFIKKIKATLVKVFSEKDFEKRAISSGLAGIVLLLVPLRSIGIIIEDARKLTKKVNLS